MTVAAFTAQAGSASANSATIDVSNLSLLSSNLALQVITASFDAGDSTLKIQHSSNGTNWDDVADSTITVATGTASQTLLMTNRMCNFYRVVYTRTSVTTGTFTVNLNFN